MIKTKKTQVNLRLSDEQLKYLNAFNDDIYNGQLSLGKLVNVILDERIKKPEAAINKHSKKYNFFTPDPVVPDIKSNPVKSKPIDMNDQFELNERLADSLIAANIVNKPKVKIVVPNVIKTELNEDEVRQIVGEDFDSLFGDNFRKRESQ